MEVMEVAPGPLRCFRTGLVLWIKTLLGIQVVQYRYLLQNLEPNVGIIRILGSLGPGFAQKSFQFEPRRV